MSVSYRLSLLYISIPAETYLEAVIEDLLPDNVLIPEGGNELKQAKVKGYNDGKLSRTNNYTN